MRIPIVCAGLLTSVAACVTTPIIGGALAEGTTTSPTIVSVDSGLPPKRVSIRLEKDASVVVILVAPGHSAFVLFPKDSVVDNRLAAGAHDIAFEIPGHLILSDSARLLRARQLRAFSDSSGRARARPTSASGMMPPINPEVPSYLLVITSPQPLVYQRVLDKTVGWSIPVVEQEALNSVAKQVKSTITGEPRDWSAAYLAIKLAETKN